MSPQSGVDRVLTVLPRGRTLPPDTWAARHLAMRWLVWAHVPLLFAFALVQGMSVVHSALDVLPIVVPAAVACRITGLGRRWRSACMAIALLTCSAMLVHIADGATEAHFHFFVMMGVLVLYEDWAPFGIAIVFVLLHHGLGAAFDPSHVYGSRNPVALAHPWLFAAIHAGFIAALAVTNVVAWRSNETVRSDMLDVSKDAATSERRLERAFDGAPNGMAITTKTGVLLVVNRSLSRILGVPEEELTGRHVPELIHPDDLPALIAAGRVGGTRGQRTYELEYRLLHADGHWVWVRAFAATIGVDAPADGDADQFVWQVEDISAARAAQDEMRRYASELKELSSLDPLTGLGNRRALDRALSDAAEAAHPDGHGLVLFHLDGLARRNAERGHAEGDRALRRTAELLRGVEAATPFRLAGATFALLVDRTGADGARALARHALDDAAATFSLAGEEELQLRAGVAHWPEDGPSVPALIGSARAELDGRPDPTTRAATAADAVLARVGVATTEPAATPFPGGHEDVRRLLETVRAELGLDVAWLSEITDDEQIFKVVAGDGGPLWIVEGGALPIDDSYCVRVLRGELGNAVPDSTTDARTAELPATTLGLSAYLGIPVERADGSRFGMLCAGSLAPQPNLDDRDARVLRVVATLLGGIIDRSVAERRARVSEAELTGLSALLAALDARDHYTGAHSEAVVELAGAVARRLELDDALVRETEQVALLHDIGKVGIPDSILQKRGPLDDDEWAVMREHSALGARIVASIGTLAHLGPAVRAEHERWDGRGYPDGLVGEDIPVASRIILACDAYHAMTSDRPYRRSIGPDAAREELLRCAGSQFDPRVIDALVDVLVRRPDAVAAAG